MRIASRTTPSIFLAFSIVLVLFGSSASALAWNGPGHMQTADVAWLSLLPAVRAVITSILRKAREGFEPAGTSTAKVRDAFDYAATFPDIIKTADSTDYEKLVLDMN